MTVQLGRLHPNCRFNRHGQILGRTYVARIHTGGLLWQVVVPESVNPLPPSLLNCQP
jgi:hypothetical protein